MPETFDPDLPHPFASGTAVNTCAACDLPLWDDIHAEPVPADDATPAQVQP